MAKKKLIFYNDGAKKKKKEAVVVVGLDHSESCWYSKKIQQEISTLISNYGLRCSIMQFEQVADWDAISRRGIMSEEFIDIFADRIYWNSSSLHTKLSDKMVDKYADKVNWYVISRSREMNKEFILRHFNELNIDILIQRKLITVDDLNKREEELRQRKMDEARDAEDIVNRFDMMDVEE